MERTIYLVFALVALVVLAGTEFRAQTPAAANQDHRTTFGRFWSSQQGRSTLEGRADTHTDADGGQVTTYRGNVVITFAEKHLTIHADAVTIDRRTNVLEFEGAVRVILDDLTPSR